MRVGEGTEWIQTHLGKKFYFHSKHCDDIFIEDLARGLAQTARWRGQYKRGVSFYSVAQHSVHVSRLLKPFGTMAQRMGLLHDGSEWPLGDMPRPIKVALPDYRALEAHIQERIYRRFEISTRAHKDAVKAADRWMLFEEAEQLLSNVKLLSEWNLQRIPFSAARPVRVRPCWSPEEAEVKFLREFEALFDVKKQAA